MCGINFILDRRGKLSEDLINKMNEATRHRGPDNSRIHHPAGLEPSLFFGANRLRIVDQDPASDQPMISGDGNAILVFSGEIYNHEVLRESLIRQGFIFNTSSDTETLLDYLTCNDGSRLDELNGMFAFIFFNDRKREILAARDRHGMKPLFYADTSQALLFSSESRGILASGLVEKKISADGISDYLKYRYINYPRSIYREIHQLQPGFLYRYELDSGRKTIEPYYLPDKKGHSEFEENLVDRTEEKIFLSLQRHLRASKPAGLMLSGGVDSSLLLALAVNHNLPVENTFTVLNKDSEKSFGTLDYKYSAWLTRKFTQLHHHPIEAGSELLHQVPDYAAQLDQPIGDSAFILTGLLSDKAAASCGILLSGAGADEYFAGYNRHEAYQSYLRYYPVMKRMKLIRPVLQPLLYTGRAHPFRKKFRLLKKFLEDVNPDPAITYENFMTLGLPVHPELRPRYPAGLADPGFRDYSLASALERDRKEYLVNDVLQINDQMALYYGMEIRSPYLDNDLSSFIRNIDAGLLMKNGRKWVLKKILDKYGLSRIACRSKEGFGLPIGQWIRHQDFDYLVKKLINKGNPVYDFIDYNRTCDLISRHLEYKDDHSNRIFSLILISEWLTSH